MRNLLILMLLALLLGAGFIALISRDSGYVLIAMGDLSIETSVWFALITLGLLFYLLMLPLRILIRSKLFWGRRNISRQQKLTRDGFMAYTKGEWGQAMDALLKADSGAGAPFTNYLMAARAAHEMGNHEKVELILNKALQSDPKARTAVDITRAELLMQAKRYAQAIPLLESLKKSASRHRVVLSLLRSAYSEAGRWNDLQAHIETLRRQKIFDDKQLDQWERDALEAILLSAIDQADKATHPLQHVQRCWSNLSASSQQNPAIFLQYVQSLAQLGGQDQAEQLIQRWLKKHWNEKLVLLYGKVRGSNIQTQLDTAEAWLKKHPNDANLLLTLGRLAMRNRQWDRARHYLEDSLAQDEQGETQLELGRLLIATGQLERGKKMISQGLEEQSGMAWAPTP